MLPKQKKSQCTAVFLILLCAYILVFCGFSSTDDEQLFIAITENLSYGREYAALPLFGNDRLQGQTGGVEPLHSIVGVPFYKAAQYFNLGKAQVLYLLPVVISALTGALLVCIAEFKSAPPKTAAFLGLVYGLGTIALPYARMNFREQLAALLITAAVLFLELGKDALIHTRKQFLYPFFSLIILGLAVLTKITTVVLIPFFIFLYLTKHQFRVFENYTRLVKNALVVVVLFILAGFTMWRILPADGLSRYTLRFFNYLSYTLPRLPHNHFWPAVAGLLFSPGKGLFIYSPILILSLVSPFLKRTKLMDWIIYMAALLTLAAVQALIYNDRWWSISWGTRALLPILPLIALATLPALNAGLNHTNRRIRTGTYLLSILGLFVQIGRLLVPDPMYTNWLVQFTGREITASVQWMPRLMPLYRHWWLALNGLPSDIIWFYTSRDSIGLMIITILLAIAGIAFGFFTLTRKEENRSFKVITIFISILILVLTSISARLDRRYFSEVPNFEVAVSEVCTVAKDRDLILIDAYLKPFWWFYLNFGCFDPEWVGLPYIHKTVLSEEHFYPRTNEVASLVRDRLKDGGRVFLIQSPQGSVPTYSDTFKALGFALVHKAAISNQMLEVFTVE